MTSYYARVNLVNIGTYKKKTDFKCLYTHKTFFRAFFVPIYLKIYPKLQHTRFLAILKQLFCYSSSSSSSSSTINHATGVGITSNNIILTIVSKVFVTTTINNDVTVVVYSSTNYVTTDYQDKLSVNQS